MPAFLPANDPDPTGRARALDEANRDYPWDHTFVPGYALLFEPRADHPNLVQALTVGHLGQLPPAEIPSYGCSYSTERVRTSVPALQTMIGDTVRRIAHDIDHLTDYAKFIGDDGTTDAIANWDDDAYFAWQRIAGPNPMTIRRLDGPPTDFAVDDARLLGVLPAGETLASLAAAGRLYLCDYAILERIPTQTYDGRAMIAPPAKGLFASVDTGLTPLAIQLGQTADPERVWTPGQGDAWRMARMVLGAADVNVHELVTHLGRTHFTQEGVAVASHRTLSERHPVLKLLAPHLRWLLFNNFEGRELLLDPGGWAARLLAGGLEGNAELLHRSRDGYPARNVAPVDILDWDLPADLARRGVDDPATLPMYPFRDDGLPLWKAIGAYVRAYVALAYADDADVAADPEVRAWGQELASPLGAGLRGVDPNIATREALAVMLHRILWSCGPLHSAVNYPQWDSMAVVPNMPAALYDTPWERSATIDEATLIRMLPPEAQVALQVFTVRELTSFRPSVLGAYDPGDFDDPAVLTLIAKFRSDLDDIAARHDDIDARRPWSYPYLNPRAVLNSTSI